MTGLLAQMTAMRERSKQLALAARAEFSEDSEIVARLRMIHDQFSALEAMLRNGAMPEPNKAAPDLSITDIEHPAPAFASRQAALRNNTRSARFDSGKPS